MDTKRKAMIPDKIEKVYFTTTEAAKILGTTRWKLLQIIEAMRYRRGPMIKVNQRGGKIVLSANQLKRIRPKVENYRSIL